MDTLEYILNKLNIKSYRKSSKPIIVQQWGRKELADTFAELGFDLGVEIGVERGRFSELLCKSNPNLHLYCIDPWSADAYRFHKNDMPYLQYEFEANYSFSKTRLAGYNCTILRNPSLEAVKTFQDSSIDFVYIDGNHDFQNATNDICEWERKIKVGGIISGHDYARFRKKSEIHVWQVVSAYTYSYGICPWFVIRGDKVPSWFWVKT